jgi:perosamine synthetase
MVVRLDDNYTQEDRDRILSALRDRGVMCSNYFTPIHLQPFYAEQFGYKGGEFPVCESLAMRTVALPFFGAMSESMVNKVCEALRSEL